MKVKDVSDMITDPKPKPQPEPEPAPLPIRTPPLPKGG